MLFSEAGLGLLSGLLLLNALLPHPVLWPIYLVAALVAAVDGLQRPALDSLTPRIVAHDQLTAAFALNSLYRNAASVAGPALAGVIVAVAGVQTAYVLDVATFAIWNQSIPDELRGRLAGVELLSYSVGPQLGQVRVGGMAALIGVRGSVWVGGLACVVGVLGLTATLPRLLAYDSRTDPHAAAVRAWRQAEPAAAS
ncbi:hypothetical protein P3T39_003839 [Kitasatospora sp. GP82]|nr:hypothetical protein [Kitasatospora sp. GP82]